MRAVHPQVREAFRRQQIRDIRARLRREYRKRLRAAKTRTDKKALKAERDAEIAKQIEPLIREGRPLHPLGHCQQCGYNLTGNVSGVCPECGTEVEKP